MGKVILIVQYKVNFYYIAQTFLNSSKYLFLINFLFFQLQRRSGFEFCSKSILVMDPDMLYDNLDDFKFACC